MNDNMFRVFRNSLDAAVHTAVAVVDLLYRKAKDREWITIIIIREDYLSYVSTRSNANHF